MVLTPEQEIVGLRKAVRYLARELREADPDRDIRLDVALIVLDVEQRAAELANR